MTKDNVTLGQVKARCVELTSKHGSKSCDNCEFAELCCCDPPDSWKLEETGKCCTAQPNWEEMFNKAREEGAKMFEEREFLRAREQYLERENEKLRTIVSVVETMLGRKFDV